MTVRDKLLGIFHFLTRKKSSKKENLSEADDKIAKSGTREAEVNSEENLTVSEKVTDLRDKQEPSFEVDEGTYEDELPTPTFTEELEILGEDLLSEMSDDSYNAEETDIASGNEVSGQVDSVGDVDFLVEVAELVDLLSDGDDVEEVEDGVNSGVPDVEDVEGVGNAEKSQEFQLISDGENEASVADDDSVENAEGGQSSREGGEHRQSGAGEDAEKGEEQQSVSVEKAADVQQQQSGEAEDNEQQQQHEGGEEAGDEDKDAKQEPQVEELQLTNKPRTFLGSHVSAGQVKIYHFQRVSK